MKNSFSFDGKTEQKFHRVISHDQLEIDNPINNHPAKLQYLDRINTVIKLIENEFTKPASTHICELGCAQANMSLLLAEKGFNSYAVDIDDYFLEYSKLKYERGHIEWVKGSIMELNLEEKYFDAVILGELIEHCAYPEAILKKVKRILKNDGIIIITTPNGSRIKNKLPTFKKYLDINERKLLELKQFGPDGADHLFLFTLREVQFILPDDLIIIKQGYTGSSIALNYMYRYKIIYKFLAFNQKLLENIIKLTAFIPMLNKYTYNNIYFVIKINTK